jgi:hypothetical protein
MVPFVSPLKFYSGTTIEYMFMDISIGIGNYTV